MTVAMCITDRRPTTGASQFLIPETISGICSLAFIIIACVGAAGLIPGSTMGWCAIGLNGGAYLSALAGGDFSYRKVSFILAGIVASTWIVLGGLGVGGIVSGKVIGLAHVCALGSTGLTGLCYAAITISMRRNRFSIQPTSHRVREQGQ